MSQDRDQPGVLLIVGKTLLNLGAMTNLGERVKLQLEEEAQRG